MVTILLIFLGAIAVLYGIYRFTFGADARREAAPTDVPGADHQVTYREEMLGNIRRVMDTPFEAVTITSHDGLELFGRYYHTADGAPLVILFHGYRSCAYRDGSGGFRLCREGGYNVLLVDQRAHGKSEGRTITFGVQERQDCLAWCRYAVERFGQSVKILLLGVSMGAATVLMASELDLPIAVRGIAADCGYSSPEAIIRKEIRKLHLPVSVCYPLVRLSARMFGGFDPNSATAEQALAKCKVPVLLIHGEADKYVPCDMSRVNHAACAGEKTLLLVPDAGHGVSFYQDQAAYADALMGFCKKVLN